MGLFGHTKNTKKVSDGAIRGLLRFLYGSAGGIRSRSRNCRFNWADSTYDPENIIVSVIDPLTSSLVNFCVTKKGLFTS